MMRTVQAVSGRTIAFSDSGPAHGMPVVMCHGLPGAHVQIPDHHVLHTYNVRMLIIDRPGFGMSDPQPGRSVQSWHEDLNVVLDYLGIAQCMLLPFSAGTPYALSYAASAPTRITRLFIVSGMAPNTPADIARMRWYHRINHSFGNAMPAWVNHLVASAANLVIGKGEHAGRFGIWLMRNVFTPSENVFIRAPEGHIFRAMLAMSFAQGYHSYLEDLRIITQHWDIDMSRITHPVTCWYGDTDRITPPDAGHQLAVHLPQLQLRIFPGHGHLLIFREWEQLIAQIATEGHPS
jgi:pimeloyl-ACP methyl ester carboxylesterase